MRNYYHKTLLALLSGIIILPMLLLLLFATCDISTADTASMWEQLVRRSSVVIIVLWFLNIMLIVLTIAIKELLTGYLPNQFQTTTLEQAPTQIPTPQLLESEKQEKNDNNPNEQNH